MFELLFIIALSAVSVLNPAMVINFPPVEIRITEVYATLEDCVAAKNGTATVIDANRAEADTLTYIATVIGTCSPASSSEPTEPITP